MIRILFLVLLLLVAFKMLAVWRKTPPMERRQLISRYGLYVLAFVVVLLAFTGRLHWIAAAVAAALPALKYLTTIAIKAWPALQWWKKQQAKPKNLTSLHSRFIRLDMDGTTGQFSGEVISGEHAGTPLAQLSETQLRALLQTYEQADKESAQLLQNYVEQRFSKQAPPAPNPEMTRSEAFAILGLDDSADRDAIVDAHRKLMQKVHPDRGGNDFLASQLNRAKELLLSDD